MQSFQFFSFCFTAFFSVWVFGVLFVFVTKLLFATLLIGTIFETLGEYTHWALLTEIAGYAKACTGAALGVGTAVAASAGFWAAIPVTMGVRALFDRYRSKALTGMRVQGRITRLQELNAQLRQAQDDLQIETPVVLPEPEMLAVIPN